MIEEQEPHSFQTQNYDIYSDTDIVQIALNQAKQHGPVSIHSEKPFPQIRKFLIKKLEHVQMAFNDLLSATLKEFPKDICTHPFFAILMSMVTDFSYFELSLEQVTAVITHISLIVKETCAEMMLAESISHCKEMLKSAVERMCYSVTRLKAPLALLRDLRGHMLQFPSLDPYARTLLLAGCSSALKTTFINKVSSSVGRIHKQPLLSETKYLTVGDMDYNYLRWQVIDANGILDCSTDECGNEDKQIRIALGQLKGCVLFFIDVSEQSGHTVELQLKHFEWVRSCFPQKGVVLVAATDDSACPDKVLEERQLLMQQSASCAGIDLISWNIAEEQSLREVIKCSCDKVLKDRRRKPPTSIQELDIIGDDTILHRCDPLNYYINEDDKWKGPFRDEKAGGVEFVGVDALVSGMVLEAALLLDTKADAEIQEDDAIGGVVGCTEPSQSHHSTRKKIGSFPVQLIPHENDNSNLKIETKETQCNNTPQLTLRTGNAANVSFWDVEVRLGILLSTIAGIALLADSKWVVRVSVWLSLLQALYSVLISAPALRFDIHWRSLLQYLFVLTLSVLCIIDIVIKSESSRDDVFSFSVRVGYGITHLLINSITCVIYFYLPLPGRCSLVGEFKKIGTTSFVLPSRESGSSTSTSITVQCWFPLRSSTETSDSTSAIEYLFSLLLPNTALFWTSGEPHHQFQESMDMMDTLSHNNKMPAFAVKHLCMARTNSFWNDTLRQLAPLPGEKKHPIALYSHGLWGWRQIHHSACENLASTGVVVFACDHTPDSMCSRPLRMPHQRFDFPTPPGLSPEAERKFFQGGMERRVSQVASIITHVMSDEFQSDHDIKNKLDFDQIHLWGHSYGGGTISTLCCRDTPFNIRSATMLDGWIYPVPDPDRKRGFRTASLLNLSAECWPFGKYQFPFRADLAKNSKTRPPPLDLVVRGADHQNFVDIYMIARQSLLERPSMLGKGLSSRETISVLDQLLPAYMWGLSADTEVRDANTLDSADISVSLREQSSEDSASVDDLLKICCRSNQAFLSATAVEFIRKNIYHTSHLPKEYVDYKAFDRVLKSDSFHATHE